MYKKKIPVLMECGLHLFMEVMNGKWKISLIWCINLGYKRPNELQKKMPKASRRVLDTQLKQLIGHGILTKITYSGLPLKVEYELTILGKTLIPVIASTAKWGEENRLQLEELINIQDEIIHQTYI
jgi:DNA-binding HxlR family transcriptional regulator